MRILVANEKHGTTYAIVRDEEHLSEIALAILKRRMDAGWYYDPSDSDDDPEDKYGWYTEVPQEIIDQIPNVRLRTQAEEINAQVQQTKQSNENYARWYAKTKRMIEEHDTSMVRIGKPGSRWERDESKAWRHLQARDRAEYENVYLIEVNDETGMGWR